MKKEEELVFPSLVSLSFFLSLFFDRTSDFSYTGNKFFKIRLRKKERARGRKKDRKRERERGREKE